MWQTGWRRIYLRRFTMSEKGSTTSAARQMNASDLSLESTKRQARFDKAKLKKANIVSPDVSKMHSVKYGNSTYFFRNKKKLDKFIREDKHYEILGMNVREEDKHKPTINEKFSKLNQNPDDYESDKLSEDQRIDGQEGLSINTSEED